MMNRVLYELREIKLQQRGGRYVVIIDGEPEPRGDFENPLEAWDCFMNIVDTRVRRRIGDMLEKQGKNRYTGLPCQGMGGQERVAAGEAIPVYDNTVCPICGAVIHERAAAGIHCPQMRGVICMDHCYENCEYLSDTISVTHCNYLSDKQEKKNACVHFRQ